MLAKNGVLTYADISLLPERYGRLLMSMNYIQHPGNVESGRESLFPPGIKMCFLVRGYCLPEMIFCMVGCLHMSIFLKHHSETF